MFCDHSFIFFMQISEEEGRLKRDEEEQKEMWKRKREHEEQWEGTREKRVCFSSLIISYMMDMTILYIAV